MEQSVFPATVVAAAVPNAQNQQLRPSAAHRLRPRAVVEANLSCSGAR
jgi:hypothetical protein